MEFAKWKRLTTDNTLSKGEPSPYQSRCHPSSISSDAQDSSSSGGSMVIYKQEEGYAY